MKTPSYAYSYDQEHYHGEFTTREDAAAEGFAGDEEAETVWTGEMVEPALAPNAECLIEQMANDATDDGGDAADDYLSHIPKEAKEELQSELQALWDRWEAKHNLDPDWFTVVNIQEHSKPN